MSEVAIFYPSNKVEWRNWLLENHIGEQSVWLVFYAKSSSKPSISWSEAVDEALCFGWIDSKKVKIDKETVHHFFSKRKAKSTWSKINKDKVEQLLNKGLMVHAGIESIKIAQQNGSWTILDEVESLVIPPDLDLAFLQYKGAKEYFETLSKSARKMMLQWIVLAKRSETRENRVQEIAHHAGQKTKPKQFSL